MVRRGLVAAAVALLLSGCCPAPEPQAPPLDLAALLPEAEDLDGWAVAATPELYAPETLYEILNGGAERYLAHGFRSMVGVRYRLGAEPGTVTLEVYDMGDQVGAFGIFSAGRRSETAAREWGSEGWRDGVVAAAWKGRVFVHGEADDDRPELIAMMERLVCRVADGAPGDRSQPAVLGLLPAEGRVPRSERLVPADLLGHGFLPGGVVSAFELDGLGGEVFFSDLGADAAAADALGALRTHHERRGTITGTLTAFGSGGFRFESPLLGGGAATRVGRWVVGAHGALTADDCDRLLAELAGALETAPDRGGPGQEAQASPS